MKKKRMCVVVLAGVILLSAAGWSGQGVQAYFESGLSEHSNAVEAREKEETEMIHVNQIGYLPQAVKYAIVRSGAEDVPAGEFEVVRENGEVAWKGVLAEGRYNDASGEGCAAADFSKLSEPGTYCVRTKAYGVSPLFRIGEGIYDELAKEALHLFYLQRCGVVEDETYGHPACHTQTAEVYGNPDKRLESMGGWHDAGDYGRYVVAGAKAAADLMLAYENYGEQFKAASDIPESGNGMPDILNEVKFELDWMMTMQEESGGVYHKITGEVFPGAVMPQDETAKMVVSPISATATGDFAAVMAMAARIYPDEAYRRQCLYAAVKAWTYLKAMPSDGIGFQNPDGIVTGEYDDTVDADERFWAAAELYRTTGEENYAEAAQQMALETIGADLGWQNVGLYGMYAYLRAAGEDDVFAQAASARFHEIAETAFAKSCADAYGVALQADEYVWGSNMCAADNGMLFLMADQLEGKETYRRAAEQQLHYLLGTNTTDYCFVTGFGGRSPEHPHHRPSQALGKPMKGMLVGGPDSYLEDPCAADLLKGKAPAACYVDNDQSYSCNEITIYWNSPLVYLLAGLCSAKY